MASSETPNKEMISKILNDINMNEKDLEDSVTIMKQWLAKQPHLPSAASDDILLKSFIIGCKSVERAKLKLDKYFTFRSTYKELLFNDRDPNKLYWKSCLKCLILPGFTPEGYKVAMFPLPNKEETEVFDIDNSAKINMMILDTICRDYYMSSGFIILEDYKHISVELTLKCTISTIAAYMKVLQEGYPMRMKGFIAFNAPQLADTFINTMMKPFFSQKLKERINIYSEDHNAIKNQIPIEMLPCDYAGGKSPSVETMWNNVRLKLESERDWFLSDGSQTVNEQLRQKNDNDAMKGTFRKLDAE